MRGEGEDHDTSTLLEHPRKPPLPRCQTNGESCHANNQANGQVGFPPVPQKNGQRADKIPFTLSSVSEIWDGRR